MARLLFIALILADALIFHVMSDTSAQTAGKPQATSSTDPPISVPKPIGKRDNAKAHMTSGIGKHLPKSLGNSSEPPAASRASSTAQDLKIADVPVSPQFGKEKQAEALSSSHQIALRPPTIHEIEVGVASVTEDQSQDHHNKNATSMDQPIPVESDKQEIKIAEAPANRRLGKHHSVDKSIAGGGVIIGGLATTFIVSIICYIRATRRKTAHLV